MGEAGRRVARLDSLADPHTKQRLRSHPKNRAGYAAARVRRVVISHAKYPAATVS